MRQTGLTIVIALIAIAGPFVTAANSTLDTRSLRNLQYVRVDGARTLSGGCSLKPSALLLAPFERAIGRIHLLTNPETCVALFAVGQPTDAALAELAAESGGTTRTVTSRTPLRAGREGSGTRAKSGDGTPPIGDGGAYGSGYYHVQWEDWANIDLTKVRSTLRWSWNGSCVDWSDSDHTFWWRTSSGWRNTLATAERFLSSGCTWINADSDGGYINDAHYFCTNDIHNWYADIRAYGNQWGQFGGSYWSTGANPCNGGPDIHMRDFLVRTQ